MPEPHSAPQTESLPPSARLRQRLIEAFIPLAAERGWTEAMLKEAAEGLGLSQGEMLLACPNGILDMMDAFAARADEAMLAAYAGLDPAPQKIRDKVRAAVRARLEAQGAYKEAARAMSRALAHPLRAPEAARILWRTADLIWRALGDPSTDFNFYSKRTILSGVLASTYARWFTDDDPENAKTWAFLDARIENVIQFEKLKARFKPLEGVAETAIGFAARIRYGR
jgi:ubiquinone biosynthesis protein COQ9